MKYLLILMLVNQPATQHGPFDDLLACEKAISMIQVTRAEAKRPQAAMACVSTKNYAFKYKEPKK